MVRAAFVLFAVALALQRQTPPSAFRFEADLKTSNDVAWLERLCSDLSFAESEVGQRGRPAASVKATRSSAYLRLGEIGSAQSLAAIARIEKTAFERSVLPGPGVPRRATYHPAPHMGDSILAPAAQTRLRDGREAVVYLLDWYGVPAPFLALRQRDGWSRPAMIPFDIGWFAAPEMAVTELPGDRLRFTLSARPSQAGLLSIEPTPDAFEVKIAEVMRDTDGDGWTDIAERHLHMNWREADSDHDGLPDGRDDAPTHGVGTAPPSEDEQILQRAIFSMFGLTESPGELHVADGSRRFHPFGLPGPLFYGDRQGGVRVTWKIIAKTGGSATVEITDFEGALAASGNQVTLKKIDGAWYAVSITMLWIS